VPNNKARCYEDDYDVEKKPIDKGHWGTVRVATHKRLQEKRVLKTISKKLCQRNMLINEVKINLGLDHPNIAKMFNVYEDERAMYIFLEFGSGRDVLSLITKEHTFSERRAAYIMEPLMSAVTYLHAHCIAHRDLKLDNLVLKNEHGELEDNTVKLIDFGLAKQFSQGKPCFRTLAGTPFYMAPEVHMHQHYDEKCDVWSCGIIMYILLSGRPPFQGESDEELFDVVTNRTLSFDNEIWDHVSGEAKDLITSMLDKSPLTRFTIFEAMANQWTTLQQTLLSARWSTGGHNLASEEWRLQVCQNLKSFSEKNRFEKAATVLVAHLLDDAKIENLLHEFKALDVNNDGRLSFKEMQQAFQTQGMTDNLEELFALVDFNSSSEIEYSTFIASTVEQKCLNREEYLWRAFKSMDQNNRGSLTVDDLVQGLESLGDSNAPIDPDEVKRIMQKADTDGNGEISFEEFTVCICGDTRTNANPE